MSKKQIKRTEAFKRDIVLQVAAGASVTELCKKHNIGNSLIYTWKKKYGKEVTEQGKKDVRAQLRNNNGVGRDAIIYLQHAIDDMQKDLDSGKTKKRRRYHSLVELALFTLMGE